ncbi:MAG: hypothetical protein A3H39_09690 [candidate division NC10 bacterium RIFCSPLOWO2_02_FULL_66_22]|nr:MAG: hypothetical protein A3H39_09690 [candidate division NC10 bacterium RIFCSPLOWO2_02_FULL_66_22]
MRRLRAFPVEELLLAQLVPGFLFAVGWTVMYEIYHEEGSYYTTLMQEILGSEGLFPYFLTSAALMAFPLGLLVDSVRHVLGEIWLGLPRMPRLSDGVRPAVRDADRRGRAPASPLQWMEQLGPLPEDFEERYTLYRHAWATLLTPAKAAGNLALVLLVLTIWFVVKIIRMGGWHVFSLTFIIGTPLVGLGLVLALLTRYLSGLSDFHRRVQESIFPPKGTPLAGPLEDAPPSPS